MQYLLFDLDGTLANTAKDIQEAINHSLELVYSPTITLEECMEVVGNGLKNALKGALCLKNRAFEPDEMAILNYELIKYYESHYATYSRAYPGIVELLVKLKEKGYGLGVISNKTETLVKLIVNELFPDNLFSYIGGGCDKIALKPDEAPLDKALTTLSINKDDVLYFGDSEVDNQFIENCKIKGGIVTWGFRSRSLLEEKNIKPLIDDVSQLEEFIYGFN